MSILYIDPINGIDTQSGSAPVVKTCSINSTVTVTVPNVIGLVAGMRVAAVDLWNSGTGIPNGTVISTVGTTTVTLNNAATATNGSIVLVFSPLRKTIPSTWAGDVRFMTSPAPTSVGSAAWVNYTRTITLASPVTAHFDTCDGLWTPATNVTCTQETTYHREGTGALIMTLQAGFTTGLAMYKTIASTDYSSYQQISFWIRCASALAAGNFQIKLCSDTAGTTAVNTLNIPAVANISATTGWMAVTIDYGANFGSAIQSIAVYVVTKPASSAWTFDNMLACKASSSANALTLTSMIGKNIAGSTWYSLLSINGAVVTVDCGGMKAIGGSSALNRGYTETTNASATTYRYETYKPAQQTTSTATLYNAPGIAAYGSTPCSYSGGWDGVNMTSQTGITWLDGQNGYGIPFNITGKNILFDSLGLTRFYQGFASGYAVSLTNCTINNCSTGISAYANIYLSLYLNNCNISSFGSNLYGIYSSAPVIINNSSINNGLGPAFNLNGVLRMNNCVIKNNASIGSAGGNYRSGISAYNLVTDNNTNGWVIGDNAYFSNCLFGEATPFTINGGCRAISYKHQQTADNTLHYAAGGTIIPETGANRHTASGIAWKFTPGGGLYLSEDFPLALKIATVPVLANRAVTVQAYLMRDNLGTNMKVFCRDAQVSGVPQTQSYLTAAINTYQAVSITVTPTNTGILDFEVQSWRAVYIFTVTSGTANATAGAVYTNNSTSFVVVTTLSGSSPLVCYGSGVGNPAASGTLTKSTGTGDATIVFSSYIMGSCYCDDVSVTQS